MQIKITTLTLALLIAATASNPTHAMRSSAYRNLAITTAQRVKFSRLTNKPVANKSADNEEAELRKKVKSYRMAIGGLIVGLAGGEVYKSYKNYTPTVTYEEVVSERRG